MVLSRLRKVEERKASRRIAIGFVGSIALLVFVAIFGLRILVGFSLLVDQLRGAPDGQQQSTLLLPPILDPLPEATNSSYLTVNGRAAPGTSVILYINTEEYKKLPVEESGIFTVSDIPVEEGEFTARAKVADEKNTSEESNIISTTIDRTAPTLTIHSPQDKTTVNDGTHKVAVSGLTDEDMKVTINGRIVVLKSDGSFTYSMPLNDGENKLTIVSRDPAGNESRAERTVNYQP